MSKVGAIILARMDSWRLPGKVLHPIDGRPLLDFVVRRCRRVANLSEIVLATSDRPVDDPLATFAAANNLSIFRGDPDDVAGRALACAHRFNLDSFARVNGDSPLMDPDLLSEAIRLASADELDFVTNLRPRSFPYGVSIELLRTAKFAEAYRRMDRPEQREHVTKFVYEHIEEFRYVNLTCPLGDRSTVRLTVDSPEDLAWFTGLVERFGADIDSLSHAQAIETRN